MHALILNDEVINIGPWDFCKQNEEISLKVKHIRWNNSIAIIETENEHDISYGDRFVLLLNGGVSTFNGDYEVIEPISKNEFSFEFSGTPIISENENISCFGMIKIVREVIKNPLPDGAIEGDFDIFITPDGKHVLSSNFKELRKSNYPSIEDQLDALWKGGDAASEMLSKIMAVKEKFPKT